MKSMTGYGASELKTTDMTLNMELKSVNHRYLDLQFYLPKEYRFLESSLRDFLKTHLLRGRVELNVAVSQENTNNQEVVINWELLDQLVSQLEVAEKTRYTNFDANQLLVGLTNNKDFFTVVEKERPEQNWEALFLEGIEIAWSELEMSRQTEGDRLSNVLTSYLIEFQEIVTELKNKKEASQQDYQNRLETKLTELLEGEVDENRLLTEVALLVERGDIQEELDRLVIHGQSLAELLEKEGAIGRELDFLLQEMNREVNTIGSKSTDMLIKNAVVQMKTLLEKIREQIQNIE